MKARGDEDNRFLKSVGERICTIRKKKGISQVALSHKCDIEASNLRRIEAGNTNVTILMLKKISVALEIDLPTLLALPD